MATPKHRCKKSNSSVTTLVAARPDLGVDRPLNVGPLTAPAGAPEVGRGPNTPALAPALEKAWTHRRPGGHSHSVDKVPERAAPARFRRSPEFRNGR
ncbi:hypothetical protein GCM10014713_22040 [Streptomyces purpureus]|uniref:Uncharacterized protein n=1 Tax=Streptomyces purpureus TaxID=1951 RepID=A0A918H1U7_9ACTN|nr:hypothetical protein GCM10014713_22040 [Streptomyces purpureus]